MTERLQGGKYQILATTRLFGHFSLHVVHFCMRFRCIEQEMALQIEVGLVLCASLGDVMHCLRGDTRHV